MPFLKGIEKIPGSGKKLGSKDKKTLAWERIGEYLIGEGADRYLQVISKLPDKDFLIEFRAMIEYFRPKLQRSVTKIETDELNTKIKSVYDLLNLEPDILDSAKY